jgi:hypothetical protein
MKKTRLHERVAALTLAMLLTLGMLGGIDHLAGLEEASPRWAAAVTAPRG